MGLCDLIPGVSGGTIAFITGIYERLIGSVEALFRYVYTIGESGSSGIDMHFLASLVLGIGTAILLGAQAVGFVLDNYTLETLSFFLGLIGASSLVIYGGISDHRMINLMFGLIGGFLGFILVFLSPVSASPSLPYIALAGFLAVSAMFLPGISGAFVLFIMGAYRFMIGAARDLGGHFPHILAFLLGAVLGAVVISKSVSLSFARDKNKTLYFLLGLVLGSLSVAFKRVGEAVSVWDQGTFIRIIIFAALGLVLVFAVSRLGDKIPKKNA